MLRRWLWLAPFALAFAPTSAWLVSRWTDSIFRNGHGIFVPFLMAYLALDHLKQDTDPAPRASAFGFAFLVAALVLLGLDAAINTQLLSAFGLVLALPGLSLLMLGAQRTRGIALPLALGLFMLPIPAGAISQLLLVLRHMTAIAASHIVPLFGVPVLREGTKLAIPGQIVEVADNCAGFATLYAAILTAIILAHLGRSPARRIAVLVAAVPLAIVCNFARVSVLILLVRHYGAQVLDTEAHPASGLVLFVFVIGALVWIAGRDSLRASPGQARPPVSDRYALATFALCALALVPVAVHSYIGLRKDDCANPQGLIPESVAGAVSPERDAELRGALDVYQYREGKIPAYGDAPELRFAVVRSYDPKALYYRGTRRVWADVVPGGDTHDWIETEDAKLPITRSKIEGRTGGMRGEDAVVAALLVYEGQPVENGWRTQLLAAPRQALTGSRPMTLFAVRADVTPEQRDAAQKRATQWLLDSWRTYRAICGG